MTAQAHPTHDETTGEIPQEDTIGRTPQIFRIVIRATPQQIWDAITLPEFTSRYFHGAAISITADHYSSLGPDGSTWGDSAVLEFDPPRRLVHGWRSLYDPELAAEPESRVTWEIEPADDGTCALTVVHDHLGGAPRTASSISGFGWAGVISGLKTLVETGRPMRG
jgi:uncharacterized protein YndB with AHSA1/START domain